VKKYLLIFTVLFNSYSIAQVNLVLNPSFEDTVSCPTGFGQINRALGWGILLTGGGGNPELFHTCCNFDCGVPSHHQNTGYQYPRTGQAYAGIDAAKNGGTSFREYIQSHLKDKLKSGEVYCVKLYVNLANFATGIVKPLGAYFDDGSVMTYTIFGLAYANAFYQPVIPQVYNTTQVLNDTLNWMKIEGSFVATGTEEYITIGNFFPDSLSDIVYWTTYWGSYYYIDDVFVIPANLPAYAGNDTLIQPGDSVFIGRQPEIGLDEDCIWFVNGVPIDTVAGLWVQPDTTTAYVVQQTICGNVKWDTVTVSVYGTGISEGTHGLTRGFRVYPNPNTGIFTISLLGDNFISKTAELSIYSIIGNKMSVFNLDLQNNNTIFNAGLNNGIYFISVKDEKGNIYKSEKIIVIK